MRPSEFTERGKRCGSVSRRLVGSALLTGAWIVTAEGSPLSSLLAPARMMRLQPRMNHA